MTHGEHEKSLVENLERDQVPFENWPRFLRDKPDLLIGLELFYTAFSELNTCRSSGWNAGPIPFTAMMDYSQAFGFSERQTSDLIFLVRAMDRAYLQYIERKSKAKKGGRVGKP